MHRGAGRFRRLVEEHFGGRPGPGCRYPASLRREAVVVARSGLSSGRELPSVAAELGLQASTLKRWLRGSEGEGPLRPVEVISEEGDKVPKPGPGVVLVTASGLRIEGLRVEDLPGLLRVLE